MIKGQVVAGDFSKIVMRVKANEQIEIGELLIFNRKYIQDNETNNI